MGAVKVQGVEQQAAAALAGNGDAVAQLLHGLIRNRFQRDAEAEVATVGHQFGQRIGSAR